MHHLEEADDIKLRFLYNTVIEVFEYEDTELHRPVEERFDEGEEIDVTVFGVDAHKIDVQFGDGSVAFIRRDVVEVVEINDEPI